MGYLPALLHLRNAAGAATDRPRHDPQHVAVYTVGRSC